MIIHTGLVKSTFVDHNDDYDGGEDSGGDNDDGGGDSGGDNDDGDNCIANSNSACDAGRQ